MITLQTPSSAPSKTSSPKVSAPQELIDISILSALGWGTNVLVNVAISAAFAGPGYAATEIAMLTAFP